MSILLKADDKASGTLKSVQGQTTSLTNKIKQHSRAIGLAFAAMGAAVVGASLLSVKKYAEMGDEVDKLRQKTGFSTESLSEFRHAAELSGTSLTGLEKGIRYMSGAIIDANEGLATYTRAFERIGINYKALMGMKPEQQFLTILEALSEVEDETVRAASAQDLLGARIGTAVLPMIADGIDKLSEMRDEAHDLGVVFSGESAAAAVQLKDDFNRLQTSIMGVQVEIGKALMPLLQPLINQLTSITKWVSAWTAAHPLLSKVVMGTTLAVGGLLVALGTMLVVVPMLNAGLVLMTGLTIPALILRIKALAVSIWSSVGAMIALLALMAPWKLAIAGVVAAGAIYGMTKLVGKALSTAPSMQHGGIVPGPIGQPTPIIAHGGERFLGVGNNGGGQVNVYVDYLMGDRESAERVGDVVLQMIRRQQRIGTGEVAY